MQPIARAQRFVLLAVGVGTFMSALDASVVNTVLPLLRRELDTSVAAVEWVTTVYLLVVSSLLLGVGRAGDLYGHKRLYQGGFILFVLGSALCGLAATLPLLVALRALQAIGAAMLFANAPAILTGSFPPGQRGRALGAQATMTYLGITVGPALGGWLATQFGWRSIFFINIPVGALAFWLALRFVPEDHPVHIDEPFDYVGAALFGAGLVALLTALDQGHAWGWTSTPVLALLAAAALLLLVFLYSETRQRTPMLDLTLFRDRVFSTATASALLMYCANYSVLFVMPFVFIQGHGFTAQRAGLLLTPQPLVMALVAPFSGALSDRIGSRLPATLGMVLLTAGLALLATLTVSGTALQTTGALALVGVGVGLFTSPNNSALLGAAPRHRQGIASGVLATARNAGMVLGVGVAGAVFTTVLAHSSGTPAQHVGGAARMALLVAAGIAAAGAVASWTRPTPAA